MPSFPIDEISFIMVKPLGVNVCGLDLMCGAVSFNMMLGRVHTVYVRMECVS